MAAENDNTTENTDRPRFELEGKEYELPELRELDVDEWMLMYKYSKVTLRDLMEIVGDPEAEEARIEKVEQPGVMKALFHIGYKREHPKKTDAAIENLVGQIKYLPTLEAMDTEADAEVPVDEVDPPTDELPKSEIALAPSSESRTDSSSANGSSDSSTSSETPEDELATTGTSG